MVTSPASRSRTRARCAPRRDLQAHVPAGGDEAFPTASRTGPGCMGVDAAGQQHQHVHVGVREQLAASASHRSQAGAAGKPDSAQTRRSGRPHGGPACAAGGCWLLWWEGAPPGRRRSGLFILLELAPQFDDGRGRHVHAPVAALVMKAGGGRGCQPRPSAPHGRCQSRGMVCSHWAEIQSLGD